MKPRQHALQSGFSTIEALISIVIFSMVGLGMAGMHAQAARAQKNAQNLYRATLLLNDLGERIRANQAHGMAGEFAAALNFASAVPPLTVNCQTTACAANQTAGFDLNAWLLKVRAELPAGSASVAYTPSFNAQGQVQSALYSVAVVWQEVGVSQPLQNPQANDPSCELLADLPAQQGARCFVSIVSI